MSDNQTELNEACRDEYLFRMSDSFRYFGLFLFISTNAVLIISLFWWWNNRNNTRLAVRPGVTTSALVIYIVADTFSHSLNWYSLDEVNVFNSCFFNVFFGSISGFALLIGVGLRLLTYRYRYFLYKMTTEQSRDYVSNVEVPSSLTRSNRLRTFFRCKNSRKAAERTIMTNSLSHRSGQTKQSKLMKAYNRSTNEHIGRLALWSGVLFLLITTFAAWKSCPEVTPGEICSKLVRRTTALLNDILLLVILGYTLYETKFFPDPFGICTEAIIIMSLLAISVIVIVSVFFNKVGNKYFTSAEELDYHPALFRSLAVFINLVYLFPYQIYLSRKDKTRSGYNMLSLTEVLGHPGARKLFEQHLKKELSVRNLIFYLKVKEWESNYDQYTRETRNNIARNIVRTWLQEDAIHEVNISSRHRQLVLDEMKTEANYSRDMFKLTSLEIFRLMETDSFSRFQRGPLLRVFFGIAFSLDDFIATHEEWPSNPDKSLA